ncbi:MAG: anti-sigma factor [Chloroflexales bacterium]|nr:anti-sigma factor [Chloroflexales bacterium]
MNDETRTSCPDPQCNDVAAKLAMSALGGEVEPHERDQALAHLASCAQCRKRMEDYATVSQLVAASVPLVDPPADLRARIVGEARRRQAGAQPQPQPQPQPRPQPQPQPAISRRLSIPWRRMLSPALGLAAALLLVWGFAQQAQIAQQQEQIAQQQERAADNMAVATAVFGDEDAQERRLAPTDAAPNAEGRVLVAPSAPGLALYTKDLPQLPEGSVYQIWWTLPDQTVSIGVFQINAQGRSWNLIRPEQPLAPPQRIFVTVEPAGGSPQPTGPVYLQADF